MELQEKIAVIVGGGSELATATEKRFLVEGAKLVLIHHNQPTLDRVLPAYGERSVKTLIANVRDFARLQDALASVVQEYGRVDIMLNCARIINQKPIDELSVEDWQEVLDVNLTGAFNVCKAVTPIVKQQKGGPLFN